MPLESVTLRPVEPAEFADVHAFTSSIFLHDARDDDREAESWVFEFDRSLGAFDAGRVVGSAAIYSLDLTVPGGPIPIAGVTWVGVAPTHRRRGLLTEMMRRQLTELHDEQREPVAVLWAAEGPIYGRFGYGAAAHQASLTLKTREAHLRRDVDRGAGRLVQTTPEEARPMLAAVHDAVRRERVGYLDRRGRWWDVRLNDPEHRREGASALRCTLHEDPEGTPDGYALYAVKLAWNQTGPDGEVRVLEVVAATPQAYAALWGHLLELDLVRTMTSSWAAPDEPLVHLLDSPPALRRELGESLWVRLVDVDRALAARSYTRPVDVVIEVADAFCPWNTGRLRLSGDACGATCAPTTDPADLVMPVQSLGAAYLGGPTLASLAAAGLVREQRPGALAAASVAFAGLREPASPEVF